MFIKTHVKEMFTAFIIREARNVRMSTWNFIFDLTFEVLKPNTLKVEIADNIASEYTQPRQKNAQAIKAIQHQ